MHAKEPNEIIDFGLLGALIRHKRQQSGFRRAEDFAKVVTELVGYPVSKETLYKVESGRQFAVRFYPADSDAWEHLQKQPNKAGYIKALIRADMEKNGTQA